MNGKISVSTENIFPIIKKFLYSDHEIFLRELIANATDATQKLKALNSLGEFKGELGDLTIEVILDADKKTLTIRDKGIGMTADEIKKYINQIAFSGAEEFVQKYKDKTDAGIIGHFGLGFYSAFMVAKKVEIFTKSYQDAPASLWECDGSPEYTIQETEKEARGTDIILHLADDSLEFAEDSRIQSILTKYCKFLPVEIKFKEEIINNTKPAWTKKPTDLSPEDYTNFYRELYPFAEEPLFHIHLNVDFPFNLTGILYFPKIRSNIEMQRNKIQLYCNQVFVTDSVEGIVPDFLTLLHGVLDSPDIPLNVSRSYLQSDGNVKKISSHITKKVADKLEEMFKSNREDFEKKWDDIRIFIQYGILTDEKFFERAQKFVLLKNTDGQYFTLEEYKEKVTATQTDKNEKTVYLYAGNVAEQHSFIEAAKGRGYDILEMNSPLEGHFIQHLEMKLEKISFVRIDSDTLDNLIQKEDKAPSKLNEEEQKTVSSVFETTVDKATFSIKVEPLSETELPVIITRPEFFRRMKEMQAVGGGGMGMMGNFPEMMNLVVNGNHPLVGKILSENDDSKRQNTAKQLVDLALLSQGMLKGEELTKFIKRSVEFVN
ncbi:MAG: molecular chaperone HtpG [Bacteroidia bacterium]|nr:molecular chaperone HtpG [Bacteroidia bacterium]